MVETIMTASKEETSLKISTIVNYILFCFMNFDLKQQVCREVFLQLIPDKYSKVFCCAHFIFEVWYIFVYIPVVQCLHYSFLHENLQVHNIHNHSSDRINRSFQSDFNFVIMTMSIWVVTFPKYSFIFLLIKL